MIFIATNETTAQSRCPDIPGAIPSSDLESLTGADFAISPLGMPFNAKFLPRHIAAGMLLIQRKSGSDFCASISDGRLYTSLARMRATMACQWQCVLMTTGYYQPAKGGKVCIVSPTFHTDGRVTMKRRQYPQMSYTGVQSAIEGWTWLGGVYLPLSCDDEIPSWCVRTETRLMDKIGDVARELWPAPSKLYDPPTDDDPLQELVLVTGWRAAFNAAFRNIGPAKVNALKDSMVKHGIQHTLIDALIWVIVAPKGEIQGWGKKTRQNVIRQLGDTDACERLLACGEAIEMLNVSQGAIDRMNAAIAKWNTEHV